jgi:DNA helicase II / ATP-dependent DNA helicase PcrA
MPRVPSPSVQPWIADLHIHSRYSRACSRDCELEMLAWWAQRKGIALLGTGDFTHPGWLDHLRESLRPAEPGLFRLAPEREQRVARTLPPTVAAPTRFMLSVEISTIYKRDERTRKVHHLIYLPDFEAVARFNARLGHGPGGIGGNLGSDGRPILGLDSRDLLEITLQASPDGFLVPAHIWTPWFSAMGSKSGFDSIADCYADLASHVKAVETGLSSDPAMNWRVASLDGYQLVSNSDAHSPQALGREATALTVEPSYHAVKRAIETGIGLHSTVEFFPEEGKYHADGHRACGLCWQPAQTRQAAGVCSECGKPVTVGVLHRVEELADRPAGWSPANRPAVTHLIQLHQVVGEILGVGARSRAALDRVAGLVGSLGPELAILTRIPIEDVARAGGELLGEAIRRLRCGEVHRTPGYDGEYGVIRLFASGEVTKGSRSGRGDVLFDLPVPAPGPALAPAAVTPASMTPASMTPAKAGRRAKASTVAKAGKGKPAAVPARPLALAPSPHRPWEPVLAGMEEVGTGVLDRLDAMQRVAASAPAGALLVVAGPGTGKTRTLTHRIAYLCAELGVPPEQCLAITFTRRAAEELRSRLDQLLGGAAGAVTVATFHALGLSILRERPESAGLAPAFAVADERQREVIHRAASGDPDAYRKLLREQNLVDVDELTTLPVTLLADDPDFVDRLQGRWRWVFVDEYQDIDANQYELLRLLVPRDGNICAIGDPDQAIYSFRGADVGYFLRFADDFDEARVVRLTRNYRSAAPIISAAVQIIAASSLVRGRRLEPARLDPDADLVGLHSATTTTAEAEWVARTIDAIVGGVSHRSFDGGRVDSRLDVHKGLSFADIAVLYRTDAQAAPIVDALTRAGIPVQKRSHNRLRDRRAAVEIARELRFDSAVGASLTDRVRAAGRRLASGAPRLVDLDGTVPSQLAEAEIFSAVELLVPLAQRCGDDLEAFLQALATGAEIDAIDPRAQAVMLLTLHAAKGLEWPVVFIVGCEDGLLPLRFGGAPDTDAVADERRLMFVGVTRAQRRLLLSHTQRRPRSPFLAAVDPGLLERMGESGQEQQRPRHRQLRLL